MTRNSRLLILGLLATSSIASAGGMDEALSLRLSQLQNGETLPVLVVLDDRPDVVHMAAEMVRAGHPVQERHEMVVRTLQEAAARSQGPLLRYLHGEASQARVTEVAPLWIVNAVGFEGTAAAILGAASVPGVLEIVEDPAIRLEEPVWVDSDAQPSIQSHEWGLDMIGAPQLWAMGITGVGSTVCNLDTGVDGTHEALAARWRGLGEADWRHHWFDPSRNSSFPIDDGYHGTHTMGIMAGASIGDTVGVAPDAEWIAALTIGGSGDFVSKTLQSFEWAADPDGNPSTPDHPDVISNSWTDLLSPCQQTFYEVIDNVEAAGAAVVFSAGNSGPGRETITSPKNRASTPVNIWSTGALESNGTIASFSSRGPSTCDRVSIKPEASAPGVDVRSSTPSGYSLLSGTSMAAPHVAGAIALLKQANPGLDPETVKSALLETATDAGTPGEDNDYGMGVIDVYEAYLLCTSGFGAIAGIVQDEETLEPMPASVSILGTPRRTRADDAGRFLLSVPADSSYQVAVQYFGYEPFNYTATVAANDTTSRYVRLASAPTGVVSGIVRDDEFPIPGAMVSLLGTPLADVETDLAGNFSFSHVPGDSSYEVGAAVCGMLPSIGEVDVVPGETSFVTLSLDPLAPNDVESGENGWEHAPVSGGYGDEWHLSEERNHTPGGSTSWKCGSTTTGDYDDLLDAGLVTHCLGLRPGAELRFWHWMEAEIQGAGQAWDGGIVEISGDGEEFVQITPEGGYDYSIIDNPASPFEPGTPCFSGSHSWKEEVFDLSGWSGDVWVRFRFGTDGYTTEEGWHIDDVQVTGSGPAVSIVATDVPAVVSPGEPIEWGISLRNGGDSREIVDVWMEQEGGGLDRDQLLIRNLAIPPGFMGGRVMGMNVPLVAPEGTYEIRHVVGRYPDNAYDIDARVVEIVGE